MSVKKITVRVDEAVAEEIRKLAFEKRCSQTELINKYLKDGIEKDTTQSTLD